MSRRSVLRLYSRFQASSQLIIFPLYCYPQHATLQGEISSFKAQISELKETLTSEYKNITPEYQVKLMDVKVRTPLFGTFPGEVLTLKPPPSGF